MNILPPRRPSTDSRFYPFSRLLALSLVASWAIPFSAQADALFRGNLQRTGVYSAENTALKGQSFWKHRVGDPKVNSVYGDLILSTPAVAEGMVYFGNQKGIFYALDSKTGEERWTFKTGAPMRSSPAVVNGTVYFGCHDKNIYALDAWTGEKKWAYQTGGLVRSSPAVWEKEDYHEVYSRWLLVGSQDGFLYALEPSKGQLKWRFKTEGPVFSSPTVSADTVYFGSLDGNVYAVDIGTGKEKWRFKTGYWVTATPAILDGTVYIPSWDGNLYALDAATGKKQWDFAMPEMTGRVISASPTATKEAVYIGCMGDPRGSGAIFFALDRKAGKPMWQMRVEKGQIEASPIVIGELLLVADTVGMRALDRHSGQELWKVTIGPRKEIFSSPVFDDGTIFFGDANGNMNAVK